MNKSARSLSFESSPLENQGLGSVLARESPVDRQRRIIKTTFSVARISTILISRRLGFESSILALGGA
jgi:hypothetical protein